MKGPEEKEDINPFPEDESYQDPDSKNLKKMTLNLGKDEKIPIKILGANNFSLTAGIPGFRCGTFCFGQYGQNLEDGITFVIEDFKFYAKGYLKRMIKGMENGKYQDLAFRIVNSNGNANDLFFLKYDSCWKEYIEPKLGRYNSLERVILGKQF